MCYYIFLITDMFQCFCDYLLSQTIPLVIHTSIINPKFLSILLCFVNGPTTRDLKAKSFYRPHHPIFITIMAIVRIPAIAHYHNKNHEGEGR
jgi:hypothetical protein